jgi:hypothetical protein
MIKIKSKTISRKIDMFDGRPDRDNVICQDDINNLRIAFEVKCPFGIDPFDFFFLNT